MPGSLSDLVGLMIFALLTAEKEEVGEDSSEVEEMSSTFLPLVVSRVFLRWSVSCWLLLGEGEE